MVVIFVMPVNMKNDSDVSASYRYLYSSTCVRESSLMKASVGSETSESYFMSAGITKITTMNNWWSH